MAENRIDPNTRNNDIGVFPGTSRMLYSGAVGLAGDKLVGGVATWIRCVTGGWVVYHNPLNDTDNAEFLQDGEKAPLIFDKIYDTTTAVDSQVTTAQTVLYYTTPDRLSSKG